MSMNKYLKLGLCSLIVASMVALVFHKDKLTRFPASFNARELEAQAKFKAFDAVLLQKIKETKNPATITFEQIKSFVDKAGEYSDFIAISSNEFYEDHESFSQEYFDTVLFPFTYKYVAEILPAAHKLVAIGHHRKINTFFNWEGIDKLLSLVIPKELTVQILAGYQVAGTTYPGLKINAESLSNVKEDLEAIRNISVSDLNASAISYSAGVESYKNPFTSKVPYKILNGEDFYKKLRDHWNFKDGYRDPNVALLSSLEEQAKVNIIEEDKTLIESSVLAELLEIRLNQLVKNGQAKAAASGYFANKVNGLIDYFSGNNIKDQQALSLYMKIVKFHQVKSDFVNKWSVLRLHQSEHDLIFNTSGVADDLLSFRLVNGHVPYYQELWQMDWYYNVYRTSLDQLRMEIKEVTFDSLLGELEPNYLGRIKITGDKIWAKVSAGGNEEKLKQAWDDYRVKTNNEYLLANKNIDEALDYLKSNEASIKAEFLKEIESKNAKNKIAYDNKSKEEKEKQYFYYFYILKKIQENLQKSNLATNLKRSLLISSSSLNNSLDDQIIETFFTSNNGHRGDSLTILDNVQQVYLTGAESIPDFLRYLPGDSKDIHSQAFYLAEKLYFYIAEPFKQAILDNYFDVSSLKPQEVDSLKQILDESLKNVKIAWVKKATFVLKNELKKIQVDNNPGTLSQRALAKSAKLLTDGQGIKAANILNKYFPLDRSSSYVSTKGMRHLIFSFPELFTGNFDKLNVKDVQTQLISVLHDDTLKISGKDALEKIIKIFRDKYLLKHHIQNKSDPRLEQLKTMESAIATDLDRYGKDLRINAKSALIGDLEKIKSIEVYAGQLEAIRGTKPAIYFKNFKEGQEAQAAYFGACDWTKEGDSSVLYEMMWMPIKGLIAPKAAERTRQENQNDFRYNALCGHVNKIPIDRNVNEQPVFDSVRPLNEEKIKFTSSEMLTRVVGQWLKFYQPHILMTMIKEPAKQKIFQDFFGKIKEKFAAKLSDYLQALEAQKRGNEYSVINNFLNYQESNHLDSRDQELKLQGVLDPYRHIYGAIDIDYLNQELWEIVVEVAREYREDYPAYKMKQFDPKLMNWDSLRIKHNASFPLVSEQDAPWPKPAPLPSIKINKELGTIERPAQQDNFKEFIIDKPLSLMIPDVNPLSADEVAMFKELHFEEMRKQFNGKVAFVDTLGQNNYKIDASLAKQLGVAQISPKDLGGLSSLDGSQGGYETNYILDQIFRFMGIDEELLKGGDVGESRLENNLLGQFYLAQMVESNVMMGAGYLKMLGNIPVPNNFPNRMTYLDQCETTIEYSSVIYGAAAGPGVSVIEGVNIFLYPGFLTKKLTSQIETLICKTNTLDLLSRDKQILNAILADDRILAQKIIEQKQGGIIAREISKEVNYNLEKKGVLALNSNILTNMKSDQHKAFFDETVFVRKQLIENPYSTLFKSMATNTSGDLATAKREDVMGALAKVDQGMYQKVKPFWYVFDTYVQPWVGMLGLVMLSMLGAGIIFSVCSLVIAPLGAFMSGVGGIMGMVTVTVVINVGFTLIDSINAFKYFYTVPVAFEKHQEYLNRSYFYSGELDLKLEVVPLSAEDVIAELKDLKKQQQSAVTALMMDVAFMALDVHDFYEVSKLVRAKYIARIAGKGVRTSELTLKNMKNLFFSPSEYTRLKSYVLMRDYVKTLVSNNSLVKSLRLTKSQFDHLEGLSLYDQLRKLAKGETEIHFRKIVDEKFSLELINDLESTLKKNGLFSRIGRYDYLKRITDPDVLQFAHLMEKMKLEVDQKMLLLLSNKSMVKETLENFRNYIADPNAKFSFVPLKKLMNDHLAHEAYPWFDLTLKNQFDQRIDMWAQEVLDKMKNAGDFDSAHWADAFNRKKYLVELEELRIKKGINSTSLDDILAETVKDMVKEMETMEPMLEAMAKDIYTLDEAYRATPKDNSLLTRLKLQFEDIAVSTMSYLNWTPTYKFKNSYQWLYGKDLRPASIKDASFGGWAGLVKSYKDGNFMSKLWTIMQKNMRSAYVPIAPDIHKMKGLIMLNEDINKILVSLRAGSYKGTYIKDYLAIIHDVKKSKINFDMPTTLPGGHTLDLNSDYDKLFLGFYTLTKKHESFGTFTELMEGNMLGKIAGIFKRTTPGVSNSTVMREVGFHQELIKSFKTKEGQYLIEKNLLKESDPNELKFEEFMQKTEGL